MYSFIRDPSSKVFSLLSTGRVLEKGFDETWGCLRKTPIRGWLEIHSTARRWKLDVNVEIGGPRRWIKRVDRRVQSAYWFRSGFLGWIVGEGAFSREVSFQARSS